MLATRDGALRLGSRIAAGYNLWMLTAFVGGISLFGVIQQWFFLPATTTQNSSTAVVYNGDDMASMKSKNPILIAYTLEKHLKVGYLNLLNDYDVKKPDPIFQPAISEWRQECGGVICSWDMPAGLMDTGNGLVSCDSTSAGCGAGLQCATFVYTVFKLAGQALPAGGNAIDYWGEAPYNTESGWKEFYNGGGMPQPGDLAVWSGPTQYGHIAIVVDVQLPQGGTNGRVLFADANDVVGDTAVGGGHLLSAPLRPGGLTEVWGWNILLPYGGHDSENEFLGFIHNTSVRYENLTTILTSSVSSHFGQYSVVGSPTITIDQINTILANANSPAADTGQSLYNLGVKYHIDPVFALAFFLEESTFGKNGVANITHSLGNIRCLSGYACYQTGDGGYAYFDSWDQGYAAWYQLISGPAYVGAGLTTVEQIVHKYAPSADNNNEAQYIQTVEQAIDKWKSGNFS